MKLKTDVQSSTIVRIYNYLSLCNWENDIEVAKGTWIPDGSQNGKWVSPCECVLHDKDGLFSSQLKVLDKYYEHKFLTSSHMLSMLNVILRLLITVSFGKVQDVDCHMMTVLSSGGIF